MDQVIRDLAKAFGKENELDAFKKARDRMLLAGELYHKRLNTSDNPPDPEYKALQDEYHNTMVNWIQAVALALNSVYALGFEAGYSDGKRGSNRYLNSS